jgi:hypothetical protein
MTAMALAFQMTRSLRLTAMGTAEFSPLLHIALAGWIRALKTGRHGQAPVAEVVSVGFVVGA